MNNEPVLAEGIGMGGLARRHGPVAAGVGTGCCGTTDGTFTGKVTLTSFGYFNAYDPAAGRYCST
ncbi:hypothetical protein [Arthrobacter sp. HLT1-20]